MTHQAVCAKNRMPVTKYCALPQQLWADRPPACAAEARGITSSDTSDFTRQGIPLAITQSKVSAATSGHGAPAPGGAPACDSASGNAAHDCLLDVGIAAQQLWVMAC